ncbi:MAG: ACT domain-containing protein [Candidatus Thorarchaeota archaeon]|nr:MAG: ACT domain-containing protein [Candidatus Thorarchaeota archaeon]
MSGERNLNTLLKSMRPKLADGEYVFSTLAREEVEKLTVAPLMTYVEDEGITVVLDKQLAESFDIPFGPTWSLITLTVHSDLEAVGFIARMSTELANAGISVNVVSAYYHDHLFVPPDKAEQAMKILKGLSETE